MLRPAKFDYILNSQHLIDRQTQEMHAWNPDDRSLNIFVKDDDCFTFHRHPVAQSTDCIRGKMGYSSGFHVWQLEWPQRQRGTHAVVGVATKAAALHAMGYTSLIGTNTESYGWDLTRAECHHDSKNCSPWQYPTGVPMRPDNFPIPDKFYCILDMDDGYMAFATDQHYLGVAFRNLQGKTLYPIVSAVWGHCEITMKYLGGIERERPIFEPLPFLPILRASPSWMLFSPIESERKPLERGNLGMPFDPNAPASLLLPPPSRVRYNPSEQLLLDLSWTSAVERFVSNWDVIVYIGSTSCDCLRL
ncbi:SPRY domain protein [Necator americanus]|uniref:SPRY domain protein n=1 Tax=Necator americanus TaxID=51031 RepID=W2T9K8_NECAM|nr:SPRY domain protein [Necator americanus]ETN78254.1 SPRY domain protein [Necator americanus]